MSNLHLTASEWLVLRLIHDWTIMSPRVFPLWRPEEGCIEEADLSWVGEHFILPACLPVIGALVRGTITYIPFEIFEDREPQIQAIHEGLVSMRLIQQYSAEVNCPVGQWIWLPPSGARIIANREANQEDILLRGDFLSKWTMQAGQRMDAFKLVDREAIHIARQPWQIIGKSPLWWQAVPKRMRGGSGDPPSLVPASYTEEYAEMAAVAEAQFEAELKRDVQESTPLTSGLSTDKPVPSSTAVSDTTNAVVTPLADANLLAIRQVARDASASDMAVRSNATDNRLRTQIEVDLAIRELTRQKSDELNRLEERIRSGEDAAIRDARQLFGRNSLARTLGCGTTLVTKSKPWRAIAEMLQLTLRTVGQRQKVGLEIADEEASEKGWQELAREQAAEEARDQRARR